MLSTFSYFHLTTIIFVSLAGATSIKFDVDNNDGLAYSAPSPTYSSVTIPSSQTLARCRAYMCLVASRGKSSAQTAFTVCDPSDQDCLRQCSESLFDCCRSFFKADELDGVISTCLNVSTGEPVVEDGGLQTTTLPSPSSASSDVQWWWFIVPLITMMTIFVAMAACWCVRLHKAEWGAQVSSTSDLDSSSSHSHDRRSPTRSSTSSPITVVVLEPPPYDSLPKDPPPYDEIYNYYDYEAPPPSRQSSRRQHTHGRSSVNNRHHHHQQQQQQQPVTMTTEPPYTDVIC